MALKDILAGQVNATFSNIWDEQKTYTVPSPESLRLDANHAKHLESATVLYADLDGSTNMVDNHSWFFSAEVYKTYLRCAAQIIRSEGGTITAYDGDRVMAIFTGDHKNTQAVRCALKINFAVIHIIRPALQKQYNIPHFTLNHCIGIDTSPLHAARIGVRGDNDIVWVGRAANHAAKLTNNSDPFKSTWITSDVYNRMNNEVKYLNNTNMWNTEIWTDMGYQTIYSSSYWWNIP